MSSEDFEHTRTLHLQSLSFVYETPSRRREVHTVKGADGSQNYNAVERENPGPKEVALAEDRMRVLLVPALSKITNLCKVS